MFIEGYPEVYHNMVKAYGINENCIYFAISEPAFFKQIKRLQLSGRPKKQNLNYYLPWEIYLFIVYGALFMYLKISNLETIAQGAHRGS